MEREEGLKAGCEERVREISHLPFTPQIPAAAGAGLCGRQDQVNGGNRASCSVTCCPSAYSLVRRRKEEGWNLVLNLGSLI